MTERFACIRRSKKGTPKPTLLFYGKANIPGREYNGKGCRHAFEANEVVLFELEVLEDVSYLKNLLNKMLQNQDADQYDFDIWECNAGGIEIGKLEDADWRAVQHKVFATKDQSDANALAGSGAKTIAATDDMDLPF